MYGKTCLSGRGQAPPVHARLRREPGTPGSRAAASRAGHPRFTRGCVASRAPPVHARLRRGVVAGDDRTWAAWSDPALLGEVAAVAQADALLSFVQVAVQDVADQDGVPQTLRVMPL